MEARFRGLVVLRPRTRTRGTQRSSCPWPGWASGSARSASCGSTTSTDALPRSAETFSLHLKHVPRVLQLGLGALQARVLSASSGSQGFRPRDRPVQPLPAQQDPDLARPRTPISLPQQPGAALRGRSCAPRPRSPQLEPRGHRSEHGDNRIRGALNSPRSSPLGRRVGRWALRGRPCSKRAATWPRKARCTGCSPIVTAACSRETFGWTVQCHEHPSSPRP